MFAGRSSGLVSFGSFLVRRSGAHTCRSEAGALPCIISVKKSPFLDTASLEPSSIADARFL